jgi:hypothetical protein
MNEPRPKIGPDLPGLERADGTPPFFRNAVKADRDVNALHRLGPMILPALSVIRGERNDDRVAAQDPKGEGCLRRFGGADQRREKGAASNEETHD